MNDDLLEMEMQIDSLETESKVNALMLEMIASEQNKIKREIKFIWFTLLVIVIIEAAVTYFRGY